MQHLHGETTHGKKHKTNTPPEPDRPAQTGLPDEREQVIRLAAYAFYEARGHIDGHALEDWLKAEAQFPLTLVESA